MISFLGWTLVLCLSAVISAVTLNELHSLYLRGWVEFKRAERRVRYIKLRSRVDLIKLDKMAKEVEA
nr:MAG TPA: hypothetical protein [Caudoviricetes sp.]